MTDTVHLIVAGLLGYLVLVGGCCLFFKGGTDTPTPTPTERDRVHAERRKWTH